MNESLLKDFDIGRERATPPSRLALPAQSRSRKRWLPLAALVLSTLSILVAIKFADRSTSPEPSQPLPPVERQTVTALGWLEPESELIKLAAPATVEASRITRLDVEEGDVVDRGQVVAVLDTAEKLDAQFKTAAAQVALKRALLARVRLDTENSVVAKRMAVSRAEADTLQASAEFERQKKLVGREYATAANLEKRRRDLDVAKAQNEEAQSALKRLQAKTDGTNGAATQIDVAVAERELATAEADLQQTLVLLGQASIRSPIRGRVIKILSRPGEKIDQNGVAEIGSTDAMMARVEVYQSDITFVRVGQVVELKSDAFSSSISGVVERVGLKVKRQSVINNDPATDTDARVVEVLIRLDKSSSDRVGSLSLLQVRAYIKVAQKP